VIITNGFKIVNGTAAVTINTTKPNITALIPVTLYGMILN